METEIVEVEEESIIKKIFRKREPNKNITIILRVTKFLVFGIFIYTSAILYRIDRPIESIILLFAVALYIILNRLEGSS